MRAGREPLGILIGPKGRGSNMLALARACDEGRIPACVRVVVAPRDDLPATDDAREAGLNVAVVPPEPLDTYGGRLLEALHDCRWLCLAGYLRLLPKEVLDAFPRSVLNIHPALLPKFGGKGMYGPRVHEAVLAAREPETGCTVHFVDERYDEGDVILQRKVPVLPDDTAETLAARVLEQEHLAYPDALAKVIRERGA